MAPSDRAASSRVPPNVSPQDRERPLLLEGRTHFRKLERGNPLKEARVRGGEVGDGSVSRSGWR